MVSVTRGGPPYRPGWRRWLRANKGHCNMSLGAKNNQHEIMLNTFSRSLIILRARHWNTGSGNEWGNEPYGRRAEQFPLLGNDTLTPGCKETMQHRQYAKRYQNVYNTTGVRCTCQQITDVYCSNITFPINKMLAVTQRQRYRQW